MVWNCPQEIRYMKESETRSHGTVNELVPYSSENAESTQTYSIVPVPLNYKTVKQREVFIVITSSSQCYYCSVKSYLGENFHYNTVRMTFFSGRLFLWLSRSFTSIKNSTTS